MIKSNIIDCLIIFLLNLVENCLVFTDYPGLSGFGVCSWTPLVYSNCSLQLIFSLSNIKWLKGFLFIISLS